MGVEDIQYTLRLDELTPTAATFVRDDENDPVVATISRTTFINQGSPKKIMVTVPKED